MESGVGDEEAAAFCVGDDRTRSLQNRLGGLPTRRQMPTAGDGVDRPLAGQIDPTDDCVALIGDEQRTVARDGKARWGAQLSFGGWTAVAAVSATSIAADRFDLRAVGADASHPIARALADQHVAGSIDGNSRHVFEFGLGSGLPVRT